jgi:bifunctional UDP-N-acetylglucosamine pyrophosphorylase/glucosamine-1-phosphate N-acetyltransferase
MMGSKMATSQTDVAAVILAAGQGTRMKSSRAKVLHELCGRSMLGHIFSSAEELTPSRLIVVVGRDADQVEKAFEGRAEFVLQAEQRGTGHAVLQAMPLLEGFSGEVLILYGDTPLLTSQTLRAMSQLKADTQADLVMLTAVGEIPGRVVRDGEGRIERIVEAQDATPEELEIAERNTGVYLVDSELLRDGLANLKDDNQQGELYITDIVGHAVKKGCRVEALLLEDGDECLGINTRAELANAGAIMRRRIAIAHMDNGVTIVDPEQTYIDVDVQIGRDSVIEPGVVIQGETRIGEGVHIKAHCVIESSRLDEGVVIGPSSRLRPNSHLMEGVKIGNFVEVKNSTLGKGAKSAHLTYIGDADVGADVNFGCGSVVVNYDGYNKHRTTVGDGVFIGCNANLVAPVELKDRSFVAAGSTITKEVPEDALAVARARQNNLAGWVARKEGRVPAGKKNEKTDK